MKKQPKATKSNKPRSKTIPPKKVTETKAQYELWNLPEYGYVVISSEKGRKVKEGTMIRQGKLSRTANTIFIGLGEFATLKGRMPKVSVELRADVAKDKLDLSLRDILVSEGLI